MIVQCSECGFTVSESMKFAIKSNSCPSCGNGLFSEEDIYTISSFQNELGNQSFSFNLTEQNTHDLALFMFNQFKHGLGKTLVIEELRKQSSTGEIEIPEDEFVDNEKERLRKEIETEFQEEISEIIEEVGEQEAHDDIYNKAERLKRLAQQRNLGGNKQQIRPSVSGNTGAMVKRRSG